MKYPTALLLLTVLLLAACGQKGPLFLPGDQPVQQGTAPAQNDHAPTTDNSDTEQP